MITRTSWGSFFCVRFGISWGSGFHTMFTPNVVSEFYKKCVTFWSITFCHLSWLSLILFFWIFQTVHQQNKPAKMFPGIWNLENIDRSPWQVWNHLLDPAIYSLVWELNDLYVRILKQFLNEVRQNKAKYSLDGQAIVKRLCTQITKATGAIKQLVKEYTWQNVDTLGCKYLSIIAVEDALSIDSPMWRVLNDDIQPQFAVPYCLKRQLIDLVHMRKRCLEE